jgi:hypothetical protein
MSNYDLRKISNRLDDISTAIELCHPDFDSDVLSNLEIELAQIIQTLEASIEERKIV